MTRTLRSSTLALGLLVLTSSAAVAQGNLSGQGFGYPPGQLSPRGLATGGGIAEVDPQTATNPAALMLWGAHVLFGQYDPEFRTVEVEGLGSARTRIARFPGIGASFRLGERVAVGLNATTYLDRTWATRFERQQMIADDTMTVSTVLANDGSINDLRLAAAYGITQTISIGLAGHFFTGEHRFTHQQAFPDTARFAGIVERSDVQYTGAAVSGGVEARIGRLWQLGASARYGGDITARLADTTLSRARIPNRYGASVAYHGLEGATISARASYEQWSSLQPLGTAAVTAFDGWDLGAGADVLGPRFGRRTVVLRAGARHRTLPFGAAGQKVDETSFSAGLGIPVAIDRAALDVTLVRASRNPQGRITASGPAGPVAADVSETAYTLSFGIRVRP
jgi:hypothetical protein